MAAIRDAGELFQRITKQLNSQDLDYSPYDANTSMDTDYSYSIEFQYWTGDTAVIRVDGHENVGQLKIAAFSEYCSLQIASVASRSSFRLRDASDLRLELTDGMELLDDRASMMQLGFYNGTILVVLPKDKTRLLQPSAHTSNTPVAPANAGAFTPYRSPQSIPPTPITAGPFPANLANTQLSTFSGRDESPMATSTPARPLIEFVTASKYCDKQNPENYQFHDVLCGLYTRCRGASGALEVDKEEMLSLTAGYYEMAKNSYEDAHREILTAEQLNLPLQIPIQDDAAARAERDTWGLLWTLLCYDQLPALQPGNDQVTSYLESSRLSLPEITLHEFTLGCLQNLDVCVKGRALVEWLEGCGADLHPFTTRPPPQSEPTDPSVWGATAARLLARGGSSHDGKSGFATSIHPDAQLETSSCSMQFLSLDGSDAQHQVEVLEVVWGMVRVGDIKSAQEYCMQHRLYWLAASLMGSTEYYYEHDENNGKSRRGAIRRPVWLKVAHDYASKLIGVANTANNLSATPLSSSAARAKLLEGTIYAALSFNLPVLLASSVCSAPEDRLWAVLKCSYERDLMILVHRHRLDKHHQRENAGSTGLFGASENTGYLYPDADQAILRAERELINVYTRDLTLHGLSGGLATHPAVEVDRQLYYLGMGLGMGDLMHLAVSTTGSAGTASMLFRLQLAIIEGPAGLKEHIQATVSPYLADMQGSQATQSVIGTSAGASINGEGRSPGTCTRLLRTYAHLLLWMRTCPSTSSVSAPLLSKLVPDKLQYTGMECWTNHLTFSTRQVCLVALYSMFLSSSRRIRCYARALATLSPSPQGVHSSHFPNISGQSEAQEMLTLAKQFFPEEEVAEIVRIVSSPVMLEQLAAARSESVRFAEAESDTVVSAGINATPFAKSKLVRKNTPFAFERGRAQADQQSPDLDDSTMMTSPGARSIRSVRWAETPDDMSFLGGGYSSLTPGTSSAPIATAVGVSQHLESLRWLFFEPEHRCEAVKKSNMLLLEHLASTAGDDDTETAFSPEFLALLKTLLEDFLPTDSAGVGDNLLQRRQHSAHDSDSFDADQEAWTANKHLYEVFQLLLESLQAIDSVSGVLGEIESAVQRGVVLGLNKSHYVSHLSNLDRQSDNACRALHKVLSINRAPGRGGLYEVFIYVEMSLCKRILTNIHTSSVFIDIGSANASRSAQTGQPASADAYFDLESCADLLARVSQCCDKFEEVCSIEREVAVHRPDIMEALLKVRERIETVDDSAAGAGERCVGICYSYPKIGRSANPLEPNIFPLFSSLNTHRAALKTLLLQITAYMQELSLVIAAKGCVAYGLVLEYLEACSRTAKASLLLQVSLS